MKKTDIVAQIVESLRKKVALHMAAAQTAHEEATHEENIAEDKYDTRGLEASYLAAGQSRKMEETAAALQEYATLFVKKFKPGEAIDLTALVTVETRKERQHYFIGPGAGGLEVKAAGESVLVLTPESPLGKMLMGRAQDDTFDMKIGPFTDAYRIVRVV